MDLNIILGTILQASAEHNGNFRDYGHYTAYVDSCR